MSDLISREQALNAVNWDTEAYTAINMLPSIDAVPLEWIAGWMGKHQGLEFVGWNFAVGTMVEEWAEGKEE